MTTQHEAEIADLHRVLTDTQERLSTLQKSHGTLQEEYSQLVEDIEHHKKELAAYQEDIKTVVRDLEQKNDKLKEENIMLHEQLKSVGIIPLDSDGKPYKNLFQRIFKKWGGRFMKTLLLVIAIQPIQRIRIGVACSR